MTVIKTINTNNDLDYPTIDPTLNLNFAANKTLDPRITFTRNSIGTYVGADGLIKTAVANEPRFDHDPVTKKCLGLMIEESRTNRIANSTTAPTTLSTSNTIGSNCLVAANTAIAPDGTLSAYTVNPSGPYSYVGIDPNVVSGETYTASIWLKKVPGVTYQNLSMVVNGWASPDIISFNSTLNASTDWIRISCSFTSNVTAGRAIWLIRQQSGSTVPSQPLYVWGPQIEVGTYATSYIPTSGSTITRDADSATISGTNFSSWYNSTEGTLVSIGETPLSYNTSSSLVIRPNTNTVSNLLYYPKTIQYPTLKTMNAYPSQVTDGLVLQLDAGLKKSYVGVGTFWNDLSGNGNTGTLINGPTYSSSNGGSIVFDGVNDYVSCGSGSSINISGNFSICVWVYLNATPSSAQVILERGAYGSSDEYGFILSSTSSNGISFQCNNTFFYSNREFPVNKWTYAVGTLSGIKGTYYENALSVNSGTLTAPTTGNSILNLGYRIGVGFYYNGNIAQVSIYNRALTAAEVQQNFNALRGRFGI